MTPLSEDSCTLASVIRARFEDQVRSEILRAASNSSPCASEVDIEIEKSKGHWSKLRDPACEVSVAEEINRTHREACEPEHTL